MQSGCEDLITFPCEYGVKIMGVNSSEFTSSIQSLLTACFPGHDFTIQEKASSGGKYLSLSVDVPVESRQKLEDFYARLRANPHVKMTL